MPVQVEPELIGSYLIDLNMLVKPRRSGTDGRGPADLCRRSGFTDPMIEDLPVPGAYCLIETSPAGT